MPRARASVLLLACLCLIPSGSFAAGSPIRGRFLDAEGAPLAKVRVRLVPVESAHAAGRLELEGKDEAAAVAGTESGADGFFRLEAPEPGMWRVIAGGEGLVPQEALAMPLLGEMDLPAIRLQRNAGLTVRVLGSDGKPVQGARVRIEPATFSTSSPWQTSPRVAVTDGEGRATLPWVSSAPVNVRAAASGFAAAERKEVKAKTVDLRLAAGPALPLRVLGADGKPAAGVLVQQETGAPLGMTSGLTGDEGLLEVAAPAPLDLLLIAADGRQLETQVQPFSKGEPQTPRELRLPALVEMTVRVVSAADGHPLAGALLWRDPGNVRRTDARGEGRLLVSPKGSLGVQAAAVGFLPEMWMPGGKPRPTLTLSLQPDLAVSGVVVDEVGAPVAGAEITSSLGALPQRLPMAARMLAFQNRGNLVRTGPDGRFRWGGMIAGVDAELRVTKTGFAPARVEVTPPAPDQPVRPLRIVLRRGRSAFGRVLGADQQPVAGAQVSLRTAVAAGPRQRFRRAFDPERLDTFEAVTGADGRFDLANLPTGRFDLTARGRGWAPLTIPSLEIPEGDRATDLGTLVLARGVALEGFVVDAAGKPVEGAEIRMSDSGQSFLFRFVEPGTEPAATSGLDGFFRIEDLRAGSTVDLSATRTGFGPGEAREVAVPAERPVRIALQAVGAVSGRVVDPDGEPIADASVMVDFRSRAGAGFMVYGGAPLSDRTDAEGSFRIADVTPGTIGLEARASGWQSGTVDNLELKPGEEKRGVEIVLPAAAALEGRVLSPSGRPVPGADVQLPPEGMRRGGFSRTSTDGDGRYVLDGLPPGQLTVEATHPDYGTARKQVELRLGDNSLDLTLEGGSEVSGRVVDDAGLPVAGADVLLGAPGSFRDWRATSRSDGSFRIAAVADGSYSAAAFKDGFAGSDRVPVTVDGSSVPGIELRLSRGGAIVGRISGVEMAELARVQILARGGRGLGTGGRVEVDGSYRIDQLKDGEWQVRAELPGTSLYAEGTVVLEPGASEAHLDLDMKRGLQLSGRVRRGGTPVSGTPLFLEGPQRTVGETDVDGRFRFQGLPPGSYTLQLGDRSGGMRPRETIDLETDREITIDLPTGDVTGRVVDAADRSPLSDVTIQLLGADGDAAGGRTRSDSRGVFVLRGVADGTWRLRAQTDGYAPGEAVVQVDGTPVDDVEIALRATEGVTLQVVTPNGLPPRLLSYVVLDGAGRKAADGTESVGEGGRVRLSRVPPGSWSLLLQSELTAALEIPVTAPGDAGRVLLPPPCTLRVTVRALENASVPATVSLIGAGGRPFRAFSRFGEPTVNFNLSSGATTLTEVPPGTWDVQVTAADGRTWRTQATTVPGVAVEAVME